ncbi:hypothetical protein V495_05798 [Pseudogymnoascus sp. VKM F-4514 (FW-929)]|nr:hypothetical protein V495_05798 [Pseudogymnoascus sp. VKM F-4514 (FW-929)]KFY57718.1 hypothetical protein V497_05360 [Pseudogymnoascus sp. VKM F-4516 (FW-969)]
MAQPQQRPALIATLEQYSGGDTSVLAKHLLEEIYRDYHFKHLSFIASPELRLVPNTPWRKEMRVRINNLGTEMPGLQRAKLVFVAILSVSPAFMEVLEHSTDDLWVVVAALLVENKSSIEFFARSRGLPWLRAVRELIPLIHRDPAVFLKAFSDKIVARYPTPNAISDEVLHRNLNDHGPDTFYLSMTGAIVPIQALSFNASQPSGLQVVDVKECIYDSTLFSRYSRPLEWPWKRWPRHPQVCEGPDINGAPPRNRLYCRKCGNLYAGEEEWHDVAIGCQCHDWCVDALVQIVQYPAFPSEPDVVNRGVRALQSFDPRTIIGEYTGLLVPKHAYDPNSDICDDVYLFTLHEPNGGDGVSYISARLYGNWTRFINHTDDKNKENVQFQFHHVMNRLRVVVTAIKKIEFGDEILGHYGDSYFSNK